MDQSNQWKSVQLSDREIETVRRLVAERLGWMERNGGRRGINAATMERWRELERVLESYLPNPLKK